MRECWHCRGSNRSKKKKRKKITTTNVFTSTCERPVKKTTNKYDEVSCNTG